MFLNIVVYNDIIYEGAFLYTDNLTFGGTSILFDSTGLCAFTREIFDAKVFVFSQMFQHLDLDGSDNNPTVCGVAMTNPVTALV